MKSYHLYVGTYGQHIHVLSYDEKTGEMVPATKIEAEDASYIALDGPFLHAVSERGGDPCFILSIDGNPPVPGRQDEDRPVCLVFENND